MISIITVTHKSRDILKDYVASFLHFNKNKNIEFIFVENSGDEGIARVIEPLIRNKYSVKIYYVDNNGFGAGCNFGASKAIGDTLIFANPDINFLTDLSSIEKFFTKETDWGTVCQENSAGNSCCFDLLPEYRNLFFELMKPQRYLHKFTKILGRYIYPSGAFFIVNSQLFRKVKGFDERFFMYYEEAELSRRLRKLGGSPIYINNIKILHESFGTQENFDHVIENETNGLLTYSKVIENDKIIKKQYLHLKIISVLSGNAKKRALILRGHIK